MARLEAIRQVYRLKETMRKAGQSGIDPDQDYLWSRRLLEAERDARGKKHDEQATLESHLDRMKQLESQVKQMYRAGESSAVHVAASEYYRLEAEFWIAKAHDH
jgi:hypothetical protein